MKRIILPLLIATFIVPSAVLSFESITKHSKIQKDKYGGYSETQRNYHYRNAKRDQDTRKGGYYEGGFHNKSPEFKPDDLQFVKPGDKAKKKQVKKTKKKQTL